MELRGAQEWGGKKGPGLQAALAGVEGATQNSSPPPGSPRRELGALHRPLAPQAATLSSALRGSFGEPGCLGVRLPRTGRGFQGGGGCFGVLLGLMPR